MRRIAHVDMDAFYASVELLRRPELRDRPVAIGGRGDPRGRGVVTTANYVARRYGVRSAMPMRRALELCPDCVFLPVDFDEYRRYSRMFKAAIAAIAPAVEDRGIDEVYADLEGVPGDAVEIGARIKAAIFAATGLTCSVGIAGNKLLAKIGSDLEKPDGLTVLEEGDLAARIWPLPVRRVNGIGPKAAERLGRMGVATIGDLAACDPVILARRFGPNYGRWLHDAAHGRDARPVVTESEPRSRSRETTFERDLHPVADRAKLGAVFTRLCEQVAADLARRGLLGRTIGIKLRFDDFTTVSRDHTLAEPTADPTVIRRTAGGCLKRVTLERRLRLLGVRVGSLVRREDYLAERDRIPETLPLFTGDA